MFRLSASASFRERMRDRSGLSLLLSMYLRTSVLGTLLHDTPEASLALLSAEPACDRRLASSCSRSSAAACFSRFWRWLSLASERMSSSSRRRRASLASSSSRASAAAAK